MTVKLVHLITELSNGGAQSALLRLLRGLDRTRFTPVVACLYNGDGEVARQIRALEIPVIDLGMQHKWQVGAFTRLYRLLRREKPAILHTWMFHANLAGRIIGRLAGIPHLVTARRNVEIGGAHREWLTRWTAFLDERVIAVCELARQAEINNAGAAPEKVITIYNGVDPAEFDCDGEATRNRGRRQWNIPDEALLIGTVGRLHPQKGFADLLTALPDLCNTFPQVKLLLIGDGELRAALEAQATTLGIGERVIFAGLRTDVPALLCALDLFVLPSLWEGLPNVILEAMASGLPVIATAVGGTPEVVIQEETGILTPPGDTTALADAIARLLSDPALRSRMGKQGRARVLHHFSIRQAVQRTVTLYDELLVAKPQSEQMEQPYVH